VGYVAAWYVLPEGASSTETPGPPALPTLTVYATVELNLRAQPTTNSTRIGSATLNSPLTVLEDDLDRARAKVGQQDQWLLVETEDGVRGWAAAWFVSLRTL